MKRNTGALLLSLLIGSLLASCTGGGSGIPTITLAYIGDKKDGLSRIEQKINEIMLRDLNVQVDIEPISWGAYNETIRLILSGGEKLDIVPVLADQANAMISARQLADLGPLIDEYGTNIKAVLQDTAKAVSVNGAVYGVTTAREWFNQTAMVMRQDILDELGIDPASIKHYRDLSAVFAQVKARYPDMIMLASNNTTTPDTKYEVFDPLTDGFGVLQNFGQSTQVVNWYETEEYRDLVYTMREWQERGYISKDAATTREGLENQVKSGLAFGFFMPVKPGYDTRAALLCGRPMAIAPLIEPWAGTMQVSYLTYGISATSRDKEKAMQVLDYLYGSKEVLDLLNWGEAGIDYQIIDSAAGIIGFPPGKNEDSVYHLAEGWQLFNQFAMYIWEGDSPTVWEETEAINESAHKSKAFGFIYDSSRVVNELAALNNVKAQYAPALGSGQVDPRTALPAFIADLKKAGIDRVIQEKQSQLDAWLAAQNTGTN